MMIDASELRRGDRVEDGGSSGRIVKRVTTTGATTRITWIDGWSDTVDSGQPFSVRERDVKLASGERVAG